MRRTLAILTLAFLWQVNGSVVLAGDGWHQFRGPDGQGHASSSAFPTRFSMEESVVWKTAIPGKGWSTPVVSDGCIWLTTAVTKAATAEEREKRLADDPQKDMKEIVSQVHLVAICVDFDSGEVIIKRTLATVDEPDPINPLNTFASPSPIIDGRFVYCHFGTYGTWCLDLQSGDTIWNRKIQVDHGVGPGSSPFISGDVLVLVCDGIDHQTIFGLDKTTGKDIWQTSRPEMRATNVEFKKAYSTPIEVVVAGKPQLVIPGAQWICGYDPATGKEIWRIDHGRGFSTSPMAVTTSDGLIVFSTGYMKPEMVAVRPDGKGDVTDSHVAWRTSRGAPAKPSPIVAGDAIYMVSDLGVLSKLDATDGSLLWQERLGGNFSASPVQAGENLIFCSQDGDVTIVAVADEYREVAKNVLEGRLMASPVVVDEQLIMRTEFSLLRIGS